MQKALVLHLLVFLLCFTCLITDSGLSILRTAPALRLAVLLGGLVASASSIVRSLKCLSENNRTH
jgi:hypothetical protein